VIARTSHSAKPLRGLTRSFATAFAGIIRTIQSQRNMKIHLLAALCVVVFVSVLALDLATRATLFFCIALVFFAEVLNTALEALVDLYTGEYHRLAKVAKDAAAGGVLILACTTFFIFVDVLWTHRELIAHHQNDVLYALYIGLPLFASEAIGLFTSPKGLVGLSRFLVSAGLLALLLPVVKDPIACIAAFALIALSACASLNKQAS
jgi:diacylglycerol kinase (ATP)